MTWGAFGRKRQRAGESEAATLFSSAPLSPAALACELQVHEVAIVFHRTFDFGDSRMTCDTIFMRVTPLCWLAHRRVVLRPAGKINDLLRRHPTPSKRRPAFPPRRLPSRVGLGETHPGPQSTVMVHYTGWTAADGQGVPTARCGGKPITFRLNEAITGWERSPAAHARRRKTLPTGFLGSLAYCNNSPRPDAPRGTLVFDIESIRIHL